MAKKQPIKTSEARIIIFLENTEPRFRFAKMISIKLNIDYGYLLRILSGMLNQEWITGERRESKIFYSTTREAPIVKAKELISKEQTTQQPKYESIEE